MFTKVLVPLDTSAIAEQALPTAAAIASAAGAELRLALVHERAPAGGYPDAPWNAARDSMETTYLADKAAELSHQFGIRVCQERSIGDTGASLVALTSARKTDLVVMTTRGRTGLSRAALGSVADFIMRSGNIPVLMLRAIDDKPQPNPLAFRRILVPLDGSARAESILDAALELGTRNATYVLARIVPPVPVMLGYADPYAMTAMVADPVATENAAAEAKRYLRDIEARLNERGLKHIEQAVCVAPQAAPALIDIARTHRVDLIAIATHGRGASRLVLGSVADKLLGGTTLPLLVRSGEQRERTA